jgi:hypothetical protein
MDKLHRHILDELKGRTFINEKNNQPYLKGVVLTMMMPHLYLPRDYSTMRSNPPEMLDNSYKILKEELIYTYSLTEDEALMIINEYQRYLYSR